MESVPLYSGTESVPQNQYHSIVALYSGTDLYQDLVPLYSGTDLYQDLLPLYSGTNLYQDLVPLYSGTNSSHSWYKFVPLYIVV